ARHSRGCTRVDALDFRMGIRRAQDHAVQHARPVHVVAVFRPPGGLHRPVDPGMLAADEPALFGPTGPHGQPPFFCAHSDAMACRICSYVPQRQMLPASPSSIWAGVAFGLASRAARIDTTKPGVQKPHCWASNLTNAAGTASSLPSAASDSA